MKKLIVFFIFVLLGFLLYQYSRAATIRLKSGIIVEGEVIEETDDSILIDFKGIPLRYYHDEIESIDSGLSSPGVKEEAPIGSAIFYSEKEDPKEWKRWYEANGAYLEKTRRMLLETAGIMVSAGENISSAVKRGDSNSAVSAAKEADARIENTIRDMRAISVDNELERYHQKVLLSFETARKAVELYLEPGPGFAAHRLSTATMVMDAMNDLKELFKKHGASDEIVDGIDPVVEAFLMFPLKQGKTNEG